MKNSKKHIFTFIMVALPVVFFALLEGGLRVFGLFQQEPLVLKAWKHEREVFQINQNVARRYFDPNKVTVPGAIPETFAINKSPATFRIICLGGSTTAGFPFDCQVSFPQQLRFVLRQSYPKYQFEVINLGISAVNSFTVVDLLPEVLELKPDIVLIYMGHNEFYGAYGNASAFAIPGGDSFVRLYLKLQKLHITQLLKSAISSFSGASSQAGKKNLSLMASVVKDEQIGYRSGKYRKTLRAFESNLESILASCRKEAVPVVISNLVSNIRDLPPFSANDSKMIPRDNDVFLHAIARGDSLFKAKNFPASVAAYRSAMTSDSSAAELWFKTGRASLEMGDFLTASNFLYGAKDRDQIRFRASENVNSIIKALAGNEHAHFLDMKSIFEARAPQGLIGKSLICDHLHPNPNGYYLMARAFLDKIQTLNLLKGRNPDFAPKGTPYYVTDLDWDIGLLKIFEMVNRWPFEENPVTFNDYQPYGEPEALELARHYLFVENVWSKAHYKMAEVFIERKEFEKARREYLAVSVFAPKDPYPYNRVAKTYEYEKQWRLREAFLVKELQYTSDKGMAYYQIAVSQFNQKKLNEACRSMLEALNEPDLTREQKLNAMYYLAGFYFELKQIPRAVSILRQMLREAPNFAPARVFLQRIQRGF